MDVRQARPTDAPLVLALALDQDAHVVRGTDWPGAGSPVRTILNSVLPVATLGRVWIARSDTGAALLHAQPRRYVIGWDITRLAVHDSGEETLAGVVRAATDHVQRRGIPRLFARCRQEGLEALRPLDFRPLAHELVLASPHPRSSAGAPAPAGSRDRMPQDAWGLHQLASAVTPALVRQLEGSASLEWADRFGKLGEIVVERDGRIVAWIGWHEKSRREFSPLAMVIHPDHADLARDLLSHVLDRAGPRASFVTRVREYQESSVRALLDANFRVVARETVVVKHGLLVPAPVKRKVRVAGIPTIPVAPIAAGVGSGTTPAVYGRHRRKEGQR